MSANFVIMCKNMHCILNFKRWDTFLKKRENIDDIANDVYDQNKDIPDTGLKQQ